MERSWTVDVKSNRLDDGAPSARRGATTRPRDPAQLRTRRFRPEAFIQTRLRCLRPPSPAPAMATSALSRIPQGLFEHIFRLLMLEPCDSDGKMVGCRTVARLARTCRNLHEPAVNVLWHTIPDIAILFFALPRHRYQVQRLLLDETDKTMMDEKIYASVLSSLSVPSSDECHVASP